LIGLAGTGDLVATALAPQSRNRRAGELLAQGVPAAEIPARVGQAVEALESAPLLARALAAAGVDAPVTTALGRLIAGELPLEEWVAVVRTTVPPPARWRPPVRAGFWRRLRERIRSWFGGRPRGVERQVAASPASSPTSTVIAAERHEMFTHHEGGDATVNGEPEPKEESDATDHRHSRSGD
jgi:hypothetical protein